VASTGLRKAAMLLMSLEPGTAAELLRSVKPETITAVAAELAYLDATGFQRTTAGAEMVREFLSLLAGRKTGPGSRNFLKEMLDGILGKDKSPEVLRQVENLLQARDPFLAIRAAGEVKDIAAALNGESPRVAAMVLMELPGARSAQLLSLLPENVRIEAVRSLAAGEKVPAEARVRVAQTVRLRLEAMRKQEGPKDTGRDQQLRKVAVLLRGLNTDFRNTMVKAISEQNADLAAQVQSLMVEWEDLTVIDDRGIQETMRGLDSRKLALALVGAASAISRKIRANMSERAAALLDEETSLLSKPKPEDIQASRETILASLRQLNEAGKLEFQAQ
jgi:flagellar motor switch protein FliG